MTREHLIALAERCEQAEGPSYELDREIMFAMMPDSVKKQRMIDGIVSAPWPAKYTASIDAALTLVPEGWSVLCAWNPTGRCKCDLSDGPMDGRSRRWVGAEPSATPALALCAAALKARGEG